MTTSTPHARRPAARTGRRAGPRSPLFTGRRGGRAAFTLTELIVATSLSTFVLAGIFSTFLLIGRTGLNASAYVEMNTGLRLAIERFDRDVRLASGVRWRDERSLTLHFPAEVGPSVTYRFEPAADPAAPGTFVRQNDDSAPEILVADIAPDFTFRRYSLPDASGAERPASSDLDTQQIEVRLRAVRRSASAPSASQLAVSARCVLRNKLAGG
jgi:hypothetical protein